MKYNTLLTGSLASAIDDFFNHMQDRFNCITTSIRYEDIVKHINVFKPDLLVICLYAENKALYSIMGRVKTECMRAGTKIVIMGDETDCSEFLRITGSVADLVLEKPVTAISITNAVDDMMEKARKVEEAKRAEEKAAAERAAAAEAAAKAAAERKHILIIDDDSTMLRSIKGELDDKYDVATALNGNIALRFLQKKTTNLILLDYEMPHMSGPAVLEELRSNDRTKDIPVIFLTGVSDVDRIKKVLTMKPQGYLLKPVDRNKLLEKIEKIIG